MSKFTNLFNGLTADELQELEDMISSYLGQSKSDEELEYRTKLLKEELLLTFDEYHDNMSDDDDNDELDIEIEFDSEFDADNDNETGS